MELLENCQQAHDKTWSVTLVLVIFIFLYKRTETSTEQKGVKRVNCQKSKQEWKLFKLLAQIVNLFHRINKACKFHCLRNVLQHVLQVLLYYSLALRVRLVKLLVKFLFKIKRGAMSQDRVFFDFVEIVKNGIV